MLKKTAALLLMFCMLICLSACGNENDELNIADKTTRASKSVTTTTNTTTTTTTTTTLPRTQPTTTTVPYESETEIPEFTDDTNWYYNTTVPTTPPTTEFEFQVSYIYLTVDEDYLLRGQTTTLTPEITPYFAADKSLTWTSSDTSVATVYDGVVTAVGGGEVTITATASNGVQASKTIRCFDIDVICPSTPLTVQEVGSTSIVYTRANITNISSELRVDSYTTSIKITVQGNKTLGSASLRQEIGYELYDESNFLVKRGVNLSDYTIKSGENFTVDIFYDVPYGVYSGTYRLKLVDTTP